MMFLGKNFSSKTGYTYSAIVKGYRGSDGRNCHKTVQSIEYPDVLEKQYEDPITHFKQIAKQMTAIDKLIKEEKKGFLTFVRKPCNNEQ